MWGAVVAVVAIIAAWVGQRVVTRVARHQDDELLEYCLNRLHVICPRCRSAFEVRCLEEQMNTRWQCEVCKTHFREYAHHTSTEEEGL